MKKQIAVLSTGGTISTRFNSHAGGLIPSLSAESLLSEISGLADVDVSIVTDNIARVNSSCLSSATLLEIRDRVGDYLLDPQIDGIVVTHGTGLMEETAFFLDITLDVCKPVVFTGAQRSCEEPDSDGPRNLEDAIRVAAHPDAVGQGVMIVFDGEIYAARDVTKRHSYGLHAFGAGLHGALGYLCADGIHFFRRAMRPKPISVTHPEFNVDLIKFCLGADARFIDCSVASGARGIVIEASGTGNVNYDFYKGIERAIRAGVTVGIVAKTTEGRALAVYANTGGGVTLLRLGALFLGDLSGQKARLLLMAALGDERTSEQAAPLVRQQII